MAIGQQDMDRIDEWRIKRFNNVNRGPTCGACRYCPCQPKEIVTVPLPAAVFQCPQCGHLMYFDAAALGLQTT